jgi:hypothetical protein
MGVYKDPSLMRLITIKNRSIQPTIKLGAHFKTKNSGPGYIAVSHESQTDQLLQ